MTKQKTIFVALLFFFSFGYLKAQKVEWGQEVKEKFPNVHALVQTTKGVFGIYGSAMSLFSYTPNIKIHRYSSVGLVLEKQVELPIEKQYKKYIFRNALKIGDEIFFIFLYKESKESSSYCAMKLDQTTLTLGTPMVLDKLNNVRTFFNTSNAGFNIVYSPDRNKVLIIGFPGQKKDEQEKISLSVFDAQMNALWTREEELIYKDQLFFPQDYALDNNGRAFLLAKVYNRKLKEKIDGESNYKYSMLVYANGTEKVKDISIDLDGVLVAQMGFMLDNNDNPLCAGFYYDDNRKAGYIGMFYCKIDVEKNQILNKSTKPFDAALVTQLSGQKAAKKLRGLSAGFVVKKFLQRSDGGFVVLAEISYTVVHTTQNRSSSSTYYIHHEEDILAVNVTPDGKIGWMTGINKDQYVSGDEYKDRLSFGSGIVDDNVFMLFNVTKKKYLKKKELIYSPYFTDIAVVSQKINTNGTTSNTMLFDSPHELLVNGKKTKIKTIAAPSTTYQVSANEMLMLTKKRGLHRLVRVTF